ncbi:NUMOD3 domain-containing DNA-binding protein [Leptolyngbya sp. CCNP1308]|uniref:NUMOD3 domain-containing DNA-binding protein n=1 Tax=Leptolyngbya sp. CCNP1308 TaxID=3110255 RepID=UPI002B1F1F04|nr:NUMOD3 domain-containing DNA-binding protein [Leptolyngbya sp. CCNP1308]MEA5447582.1 NUMOD3 domain-containing DNA-binding protein [Leptolyngbya sp. CCNP1308]
MTISQETRRKLSLALRGRKQSEESRKKNSECRKGVPLSEEHKKNIGKAHKGKFRSLEARQKMSKAHIGRTLSEEARQKISESKRGKSIAWKPHSEATIEKIRKVNSKSFRLLSPSGEIVEGSNLREFCRQNDLNPGNMCQLNQGKIKSAKGWRLPDDSSTQEAS